MFREREINLPDVRRTDEPSARISKSQEIAIGVGGRRPECGGVDPIVGALIRWNQWHTRNQIRALVAVVIAIAEKRPVRVEQHSQRMPGVEDSYAAEAPSTEDLSDRT